MTLVRCFRLRAVLTQKQWDAVAPFARDTFTETWVACGGLDSGTYGPHSVRKLSAREALRDAAENASGNRGRWWRTEVVQCTAGEGRAIEKALYERALALGVTPVMFKPRSQS